MEIIMKTVSLTLAAIAFAVPAFAQDGTATSTVTETTTVSTGIYTFDLSDTSGGTGETFGDYEEARPGEAAGPDVTFDLE